MTFAEFNALSVSAQLLEILNTGTWLATRRDESEDENEAHVYQLPGGLFVGIGTERYTNRVLVQTFMEEAKLEYYALFVKLPDWLPEAK